MSKADVQDEDDMCRLDPTDEATSSTWARREARSCPNPLPIAPVAPDEFNAALFKHWKAHS